MTDWSSAISSAVNSTSVTSPVSALTISFVGFLEVVSINRYPSFYKTAPSVEQLEPVE